MNYNEKVGVTKEIQTRVNKNTRQIGLNIVGNIVTLLIGIISGLVLTPYLIKSMGIEAYGMVPLVNNLISYFSIVTVVINSATGRFVTIAISRQQVSRAQSIINTTLTVLLSVNGLIIVAGIYGSNNIEKIINVPKGYEIDAQVLLILAIITWFFMTMAITAISLRLF